MRISRAVLKDQLIAASATCRSPFTVAELLAGVNGRPAASTVDRALDELCEAGLLTLTRSHPQRQYVLGRPERATVADPAPDFTPGYPSRGERLAGAWQVMWHLLADGSWWDVGPLIAVAEEHGDVAAKTARNLLLGAVKARVIEHEARFDDTRKRWCLWYRRPDRVEHRDAEAIATDARNAAVV